MRRLAALALAFLAACGFQLRGTASLPFETMTRAVRAALETALTYQRDIKSGGGATS